MAIAATLYFHLHPSLPPVRVSAPPALEQGLWQAYASRFVEDGRVLDTDNGGVSHSEGQGYGMLLAEAAGDHTAFQSIWSWTRSHMQRADALFSWRYGPCSKQPEACEIDNNNATDGDILIAWALLRAAERWDSPEYRTAAKGIVTALERLAVLSRDGRSLLLPGLAGFVENGTVTVNLSYWIFPAFELFATQFDAPVWRDVAATGRELIDKARFGAWNLPPDWLDTGSQGLKPSSKFEPVYGFNAIRIPLHMVWAGETSDQALKPFLAFWAGATHPAPAWVNLADNSVAKYGLSAGAASIEALTRARAGGNKMDGAALPKPGKEDGYFSWSLALLSRIAAQELGP
jgi:endoglucanase